MDRQIRCAHCNRLLAVGEVKSVTIKCPRRKSYNTLRESIPNNEHRESPLE